MKSSIQQFLTLAEEPRFKGWPLVPGSIANGSKIDFFGSTVTYQLLVDGEVNNYTSIIRSFGWAVVFGVTKDNEVITLCQWKPGVNQASWELPPGGIGKLPSGTPIETITELTIASFLKETGYGNGNWKPLGKVMIETGKYRGASIDDHGLPAYMFLATDLEKIADARNPEKNEIMETIMVPLNEFPAVLESGLFTEASAVPCAHKALDVLAKRNARVEVGSLKLESQDTRRTISELNYTNGSCALLDVHDGSKPLGQHYHKNKTETFLVVQGSGTVRTAEVDDEGMIIGDVMVTSLTKNSVVVIPPMHTHRFDLEIGTSMVMISSTPFDPDDMLACPINVE